MKDRFSRLLAACELLARDETAALADRNFTALCRTQKVKSALLADLATDAGCASRDSRARLERLLEANGKNSQLLSTMKAAAGQRLCKVRAAGKKLKTLRAAYTQGGMPPAFSAHG
jgi:hypothetical protein